MTRVAEDLRQPAQLWMLAAARATLALAQGDFDEAPALIQRAYEVGAPRRWPGTRARRGRCSCSCSAASAASSPTTCARSPITRARSRRRSCTARCSRTRSRAARARRGGGVARARDHAPRPVGVARRRAVARQRLPARGDRACSSASSRPLATLYDLLLRYGRQNAVAVPELALDSASRPLGHPRDCARPLRRRGAPLPAGGGDERADGRAAVAGAHAQRARPHAAPARRRG